MALMVVGHSTIRTDKRFVDLAVQVKHLHWVLVEKGHHQMKPQLVQVPSSGTIMMQRCKSRCFIRIILKPPWPPLLVITWSCEKHY